MINRKTQAIRKRFILLITLIFFVSSTSWAATVEGYINKPNTLFANSQRLEFRGKPGPNFNTRNITIDGFYRFDNVPSGNYQVKYDANFSGYKLPSTSLSMYLPNLITVDDTPVNDIDIDMTLGVLQGEVSINGLWGFADLRDAWMTWNASGTVRAHFTTGTNGPAPLDGTFRVVGPAGVATNNDIIFRWVTGTDGGGNYDGVAPYIGVQSLDVRFHGIITESLASDTTRQLTPFPIRSISASETQATFEVPSGNISQIEFHCAEEPWDYCLSNAEFSSVSVSGRAYNFQNSSSSQTIKIMAVAGTYPLKAIIQTDTQETFTSYITITLSEPVHTPVNSNEVLNFENGIGATIGTLDFNGSVTQAGQTTFNELTDGPTPSEGFQVYAPNNTEQYFDIITTADFSGLVQVCVNYDDSPFASDAEEKVLQLSHYVLDEVTQVGTWDNITDEGYPLTDSNTLCGTTDSFSTFAIVVSPDSDNDGVPNVSDNCPATYNPEQEDFDEDSLGDVCDVDSDNDGVANLDDFCPSTELGSIVPNSTPIEYQDNGCTSEQRLNLACPASGQYRNHGKYVSCITTEAHRQVDVGLINKNEIGSIVAKVENTI